MPLSSSLTLVTSSSNLLYLFFYLFYLFFPPLPPTSPSHPSFQLLGRCRKVSKQLDPSFVDLGHEAFGPLGALVVTASIVAMSIGVCAAYLVFISGTVESVLLAHGSPGLIAYMNTSRVGGCLSMLIILPLAVPLSWMRDFKYIAYTRCSTGSATSATSAPAAAASAAAAATTTTF
jgi:hypothetical protein